MNVVQILLVVCLSTSLITADKDKTTELSKNSSNPGVVNDTILKTNLTQHSASDITNVIINSTNHQDPMTKNKNTQNDNIDKNNNNIEKEELLVDQNCTASASGVHLVRVEFASTIVSNGKNVHSQYYFLQYLKILGFIW